jgi:cation diffusion facilitator CzcD-associated flavoprotein CzcO
VLPRRDRALTGVERWLFGTAPATQRLARSSIYWVREGFTAGYLPALTRPNVELVTAGIREVRPHGILTDDGVEHPADTIIFGTGFHVTDSPVGELVRGRDGRTLAKAWEGSPKASGPASPGPTGAAPAAST